MAKPSFGTRSANAGGRHQNGLGAAQFTGGASHGYRGNVSHELNRALPRGAPGGTTSLAHYGWDTPKMRAELFGGNYQAFYSSAGGGYLALNRVRFETAKAGREFGHPIKFTKKHSWTEVYSASAKSKEQLRDYTVAHEYGHHIHFQSKSRERANTIIEKAWSAAVKRGAAVSDYALTMPEEYFAETFAAYQHHPRQLRRHDPAGYHMVSEVLKLNRK